MDETQKKFKYDPWPSDGKTKIRRALCDFDNTHIRYGALSAYLKDEEAKNKK